MASTTSNASPKRTEHEAIEFELQQSESRRAEILAGVFIVLGAFTTLRHYLGVTGFQGAAYLSTLLVAAAGVAWSMWLRRMSQRATQENRLIPIWFWALTVVAESLFPILATLAQIWFSGTPAIEALQGPPILMFGILAVTSILRLRPVLGELGALVCGATHIALSTLALADLTREEALRHAPILYAISTFIIIAWVVAALIARELRRHVLAGLREARTRAELAGVTSELNVARQIQQSLMPKGRLELEGTQIAGWNRPASQTGGDYFDWQIMNDGRVAISIADVTGHGIGPALIMAVCRAYARATVPQATDLQHALTNLNNLVSDDVGEGRFVTSAFLLLDPASGNAQLLSAGHGPIVLRRLDGAIEIFGGDGPPLGVVPGIEYEQPNTIQLNPGDALLLVTDGFVEAQNAAGTMFGTDRLREFLVNNATLPPGELLPRLDAAVRAHCAGEPQADDMTAVMILRDAPRHSGATEPVAA